MREMKMISEIEQLIGHLFGREGIEYSQNSSCELEIRRPVVGDENACMVRLCAEGGFVQSFKVTAIMCEDCTLVSGGKIELHDIGIPEILCVSGRQDIKSMWVQKMGDKDGRQRWTHLHQGRAG